MSHQRKSKRRDRRASRPGRYRDVLLWWVPVLLFLGGVIVLRIADLKSNGDHPAVNARTFQPTMTSMTVITLCLMFGVAFVAGVLELLKIRREHRNLGGKTNNHDML